MYMYISGQKTCSVLSSINFTNPRRGHPGDSHVTRVEHTRHMQCICHTHMILITVQNMNDIVEHQTYNSTLWPAVHYDQHSCTFYIFASPLTVPCTIISCVWSEWLTLYALCVCINVTWTCTFRRRIIGSFTLSLYTASYAPCHSSMYLLVYSLLCLCLQTNMYLYIKFHGIFSQ